MINLTAEYCPSKDYLIEGVSTGCPFTTKVCRQSACRRWVSLQPVLYVFGPYVSEPRKTLDLVTLDGLNFICCLGVLG